MQIQSVRNVSFGNEAKPKKHVMDMVSHREQVKAALDAYNRHNEPQAPQRNTKINYLGTAMMLGSLGLLATDSYEYKDADGSYLDGAQKDALVQIVPNSVNGSLEPQKGGAPFTITKLEDDTFQYTSENTDVTIKQKNDTLSINGTINGSEVNATVTDKRGCKAIGIGILSLLGLGVLGVGLHSELAARRKYDESETPKSKKDDNFPL